MLTVTTERPGDLAAIGARWQAFEALVACSFFQSWAWLGCLGSERFDDPVLVEARRDGALVAMALFNRRRAWPGPDRLWLGESGRAAWDCVFVEHNGALHAPGEAAAVRQCLAAARHAGRRGGVVTLSGVDEAHLQAIDALGACVARQTRLAPHVDLTAPGAYLDRLSANARQQARRSARRYAALGAVALTRAADAGQAHGFLDAMAALHQARWTARGKPGAFAQPHFARFHHALIDRSPAVELLRVTAGGGVVGYLHNFRFRGRVSAYQSGFDYAAAPPHAKPGITCHVLAIEHYRTEGLSVYDFLAGDDRYKTSLATGSVPLHWVTVAPAWSWPGVVGRLKAAVRGASVAGLLALAAAAPPAPAKPGDIVGVVLQNEGAAMPARPLTFGQAFAPGQVPAGSGLVAMSGGHALATQFDAKAVYADGSARIGVVTIAAPPLAAHGATPVMLALAGAPPGNAVDLAALLATYDLTVDLAVSAGAAPIHLDARALLGAALRAPGAAYWLRGPQASEMRVDVPVTGSLHATLDIRGYADGTSYTDVQLRNDLAMQPAGGALTYDATIRLGGKIVVQRAAIHHFQYQSWHQPVWSGGPPGVGVVHDVAALERTGLVANYDLAGGVSPAVLAAAAKTMAGAGWGAPLAANGVTQYMPTTGGRGDIGPTTQANAVWLVTQTAAAAAFALGQADAAGAVPWQFWNGAAGTWLNTDAYADIWVDGRGGAGSYTTGLTQQVDPGAGWATDTAHEPDLTYVAYLLLGRRRDLDLLNAQAAFSVTVTWPAAQMRNSGEANVIRGNQVRAAAWSLREIDQAAWSNPPGSPEQVYFAKVAAGNWQWLAAQLPRWSRQAGATAGYIMDAEYGDRSAIVPWQQDYFVAVAVQAAQQGNAQALAYLRWSEGFIAGRFLNQAAGFNPHNGAAYVLSNALDGRVCESWAGLQQATHAAGQDNGAGWAQSNGDYGALAMASLAGLITVTGSPRAAQAYRYLANAGAPHTDAAARQTDVQLAIVPRPPAREGAHP